MIVDVVDRLSGAVWSGSVLHQNPLGGSEYSIAVGNKLAQKIDVAGRIYAAIEDHEGRLVANSNCSPNQNRDGRKCRGCVEETDSIEFAPSSPHPVTIRSLTEPGFVGKYQEQLPDPGEVGARLVGNKLESFSDLGVIQ
jgi:hypothetical protein